MSSYPAGSRRESPNQQRDSVRLDPSQLQFTQDPSRYDVAGRAPTIPTTARRRRRGWGLITLTVVLGVIVGLAWLLLVPAGKAIWNGQEWLPIAPELWLRQDLTFAALAAVAGLITGITIVAGMSRSAPVARVVVGLFGSALGSAIALGIGMLLRPASATRALGASGSAPLELHALGFGLTWPLLAMASSAVLLILGGFRGR